MARRGDDLAGRCKAALDSAASEARRQEEDRQRQLAEGRKERDALFEDLAAFGQAVGHIATQRAETGVTFRYQDRYIHFEPMGEGERLKVTFDGIGDDEHRLYRETALGSKWVWVVRRRGREDRLPFWEAGLEELLVLALKLPRPGETGPPAAQPTLDDAVPKALVDTDDKKKSL